MEITDVQKWIEDFYQKRGWLEYSPFIRLGFLMEEVGEVARAVRAYEIGRDHPNDELQNKEEWRQELIEELGDVIGNLTLLASLYGITLEDIVESHKKKLTDRFAVK
ncbi:MazG nucleotide pyrophosphohydrolase domain-containing protein [Terrilactibacillus laevilacticus]|uniref:MazG nucleotide pyrophosphohydrolase domain-containing protein n=1 Tax=Terrilactibacillus laevilacticus TaxID=1380157 RepID=A0ABW5PR00_9BACI|nr:MazG-like family protein [Terrilactibacillus laevilacticus]